MTSKKFTSLIFVALLVYAGSMSVAFAQALSPIVPPAADASRFNPEQNLPVPDHSQDVPNGPASAFSALAIPETVKNIHLTLTDVHIVGATVFSRQDLHDLYGPLLGTDVTLDVAWTIANKLTERYRDGGYFLSRAYVPQQDIKDGVITINVVEGYIGKVELPTDYDEPRVVRKFINRLLALKPATADGVESLLLRLNDLPGVSFRAVMSPLDDKNAEGAIKMSLVPGDKSGEGFISFDNFSSRYLGPNEASLSYQTSIIPLEQTSGFVQTSTPADKLRYGSLDQKIVVDTDLAVELSGGVTKAYPGYTLRQYDINSNATSESVALDYQWIRQRRENLSLKFTVDNRDVTSYLLGSLLTQDLIHAARANATYDLTDNWRGYNSFSTTLSQGLNAFGNSQETDVNLSRAGALPNFTKAEYLISRQQGLTDDWSVFLASSGQWASGPLYSSEQYGYGGQAFGRAYDPSDITGDRGVSGSFEIRYEEWRDLKYFRPQPYAFFDIGKVWNITETVPQSASGSSAGAGFRFSTPWNQTGNFGVAFPLSRSIEVPIYGASPHGPRAVLQISQAF